MDYPSVSIIISFYQRLPAFERTLASWTNLDYPSPVEFILIDDANEEVDKVKSIIEAFISNNPNYYVKYVRNGIRGINTNVLWNTGYKESKNEFVVYCMADIIPSTKSILKVMVDNYKGVRVSVVPYYLTNMMTTLMNGVDWKNNPRLLETLPGFWTDKAVVNTTRVAANLLTCLTGQYRKDWEWFGLFRTNETGYLWIDQDVAIREQCLKKDATSVPPSEACCYHQWHGGHAMTVAPGYRYKTEREARLLDPAEVVHG